MERIDPSIEDLILLDGQVLVVDPKGGHWVKFVVRRVPITADRPHGLSYSLTLHDATGARLVGFDNAHPVKAGGSRDHKHGLNKIKSYEYISAADLLADFWAEVDAALKARGVLP